MDLGWFLYLTFLGLLIGLPLLCAWDQVNYAPLNHVWYWLSGPKRRVDELRKRADEQHAALVVGED
jgi:hypothetical protein